MKAHQVVHLKACDQFIQDRYSLLRSINPAVWDAAVQTMRYTAFFRYCKFNHPLIWKKFIQQIIDARTTMPEIITPTVMIHRDSLID